MATKGPKKSGQSQDNAIPRLRSLRQALYGNVAREIAIDVVMKKVPRKLRDEILREVNKVTADYNASLRDFRKNHN